MSDRAESEAGAASVAPSSHVFDDIPTSNQYGMDRWMQDSYKGPINERLQWLADNSPHDCLRPEALLALRQCDDIFGFQPDDNLDTTAPPAGEDMSASDSSDSTSDPSEGNDMPQVPASHTTASWPSTESPAGAHVRAKRNSSFASMPSLAEVTTQASSSVATTEIREINRFQTARIMRGPVEDGELDGVQQEPHRPTLTSPDHLQCPFHFLKCPRQTSDPQQWVTHAMWHLKRCTPPTRVACSACRFGPVPWEEYLCHLFDAHKGQVMSDHPIDKDLLVYLRQKAIISIGQYQVLLEEGRLDAEFPPFSMMHNKHQENRRLQGRDRPTSARC
ncbi:hypothetical protein CAC42_4893 [Sphaceloma murrayae]|uniref:Uncharacterized protein n=1 Tax=Sphaceloma murrayae TaxID=2082308 RepID=A0A2K1QPQ4_9PEZI|nr:hypothetical protein CAC42_4893 [Sphaceloma murrayae]